MVTKTFRVMLVSALALLAFAPATHAQAKDVNHFQPDAAIPATRYTIESELYTAPREILVQLPISYNSPEAKHYPVIYLLDGDRPGHMKALISIARDLASRHKMPEVIIVAIPAGETRQVDYTPNDIAQHSSEERGNSDRFTRFLEDELIPHIDSAYRTYPFRVISGLSRGGLFVLNDLLDGTGLFQAHIAFSPALWASDYAIIDRVAAEAASGALNDSFLFINAGGDEEPNILQAYRRMEKLIAHHGNAIPRWQAEFHEHDSHGTTSFVGHYLALRALYTNWDLPWELLELQGLSAIVEQHDKLSAEFGYPVIPDEADMEAVGYAYLEDEDLDGALEAFQLYVRYHPRSPNARDGLAEAFERTGDFSAAKKEMELAVNLLGSRNDRQADWIRSHYGTLVRLLGQ